MDAQTLECYTAQAAALCAFYQLVAPTEVRQFALSFFHAGEPSADIGCGSGRDVAWLSAQGFPTIGYDASQAMLAEARRAYPGIDVREAALPDLAGVPDAAYANVLCTATLMHLPSEELISAALRLARVLRPGGRLLLSYRSSVSASAREADGRLFTPLPPGKLTLLLEAAGLVVLTTDVRADTYRSAVQWYTLLAEKRGAGELGGLERIQQVLVQDRKVATYKFALLRALCILGRTQSHLVRWGAGVVYVPLWSISIEWLIAYWPLLTAPAFIAQKHGERPGDPKPLAFRRTLTALAAQHGRAGLYDLLRQIEAEPLRFRAQLKRIAETIRSGPVTYAGSSGPRLFGYERTAVGSGPKAGIAGTFGWVVVPEEIWLDLCRFDHWIEDSSVVRWARLTAEMNAAAEGGLSAFVPLLLAQPQAERDTREVRQMLGGGAPRECVWSGRPLGETFAVDHMVPYAVWGNNDVWNLLLCLPQINQAKRDALPTRGLLLRRTVWGRLPARHNSTRHYRRCAIWTAVRSYGRDAPGG